VNDEIYDAKKILGVSDLRKISGAQRRFTGLAVCKHCDDLFYQGPVCRSICNSCLSTRHRVGGKCGISTCLYVSENSWDRVWAIPKRVKPKEEDRPLSARNVKDQLIRDAIFECNGNKAEAARRLGVSRSTVWRFVGTERFYKAGSNGQGSGG